MPARRGGEFFFQPVSPAQRRYEALRAYLAEGLPAVAAAERFGYTPAAFSSLVRDFRAGKLEFFPALRTGPRRAPAKDAAHARVLELRLAGHSIDEISAALAAEGTPLNRTGVSEIIAEEGLPRLWRRPEHARGGVRREVLRRAEAIDFADLPALSPTRVAGLLLTIPDLVALDLPALVEGRLPGHEGDPGDQLAAVAARTHPHRHPPRLPCGGPRGRPRGGSVRRAGRTAEKERPDRLLLPT